MSMSNAFRQIREATAQRDHRATWVPANIGAVVDGANTIPSPHGGAWIFVTLTKGGQSGAVSEALCHKITPAWNCPVLLSVNKQGFYIVEEVDPARYDMWTSGNDGGVLGSHNVAPHTHDDETSPLGQDFVSNRRLRDGRVEWRNGDDGPYTVYIHPFTYADINGADTYWPGGTLDLSTYLTVAADQWQWIKVGMDRTNLVPTALAGTATPTGVPLNVSDLAAISFTPNLPLAGVLIIYNQAIQSQDDITDCSLVKSPGASVGTSSDVLEQIWLGCL